MPFGKRTTPPDGDVVLEQMLGHFQGGGSIEDFVVNTDPLARGPLRDDRTPAERAADYAYISLLLRIDEPEAHAQVQAASNRRDSAGQDEFKLRHAQANREAAQRGCSDGLDPFLIVGRSIWMNKRFFGLMAVALSLTPYEDWNVMFLPQEELAAKVLPTLPHPNQEPPEIVHAANVILEKLDQRWEVAYEAAKKSGDVEALDRTARELAAEVRSFGYKTSHFLEQLWRRKYSEQRRAVASY